MSYYKSNALRNFFVEHCSTPLYQVASDEEKVSKVRGIRFSSEEEALVEEFLSKNPFIDFTTLSKIAILNFIKNPELHLVPIDRPSKKEKLK